MAIAITNPAPAHSPLYRVGPFTHFEGTISGPTSVDDFVTLSITWPDGLTTHGVAYGESANLGGGTFWSLELDGIFRHPVLGTIGPFGPGRTDGANVGINLQGHHASGTVTQLLLLDDQYAWDPVSLLWLGAGSSAGGHDPMLDLILASVRATYSNA